MLSKFKQQIESNHLCGKENRILLAISGGVDSMTMLDLFRLSGYALGVAHCNFQLRGSESDKDESFVNTVCNQWKIPFYAIRLDTHDYACQNKLSTQVAARELRYSWFADILKKESYHYIATAHQLNDNIETVILNFVRGSGVSGISGIPIKTGKIIRPLLNFSRSEIEKYARDRKILWREDSTNNTEKYYRNKLRIQVIPRLKELNPSLENTFLRTQQRLAGAKELFILGKKHLEQSFITSEDNCIKINKSLLLSVQHPTPIIWEMIKKYGFNYDQCDNVVKKMKQKVGRKILSSTHQLTIDREFILISTIQPAWETIRLDKKDIHTVLGPWQLKMEFSSVTTPSKDRHVATLDADTITFPIQWRKWAHGDYFYPLGMNHRKKVSDFFVDEKLSLVDKEISTVIESNGNIIWIVGYRIDNRFRVTNNTTHVLNLILKSCFSAVFFFFI